MTSLTDPSRTLAHGLPYTDTALAVPCPRCRADVGVPCTVGRGSAPRHVGRVDRRLRLTRTSTLAELHRRERAMDPPSAHYWTAPAHPCGTAGVHTMDRCAPFAAA